MTVASISEYAPRQQAGTGTDGEYHLPTLYGALLIIGQRWYLPTLLAILCAAAAFGATQFMRVQYSAEGALALDRASFAIPEVQAIRSDRTFDPATPRTELRALVSPQVLGTVVDRMNLASDPDFVPSLKNGQAPTPERARTEAVDSLKDRVTAFNDVQSYALMVNVEAYEAAQAVDIVNAILDTYLENQAARRTERLQRAASLLSGRRDQLRVTVEEAGRQLQEAAGRANQIKVQEGLVASRRLDSLSEERLKLQMRADQIAGEIIMIRTALAERSGIARLAAVIESTALDRLGKLEAELQSDSADVSSHQGPLHPQRVAVRERLNEIRAAARQTAQSELTAREARLDATRNRMQMLADQITEMTNIAAEATREQSEIARLERDVKAKQEELARYEERLAQTAASIDTGISDVVVAARPILPSEPTAPRVKLLVFLGALAGAMLGSALALVRSTFGSRFESANAVQRITGMRPLAAVPRVRPEAGVRGPALPAMVAANPHHPAVESLRSLVINLVDPNAGNTWNDPARRISAGERAAELSSPNRVIAIASASPGSGKTSLCLALGRTAALEGFRTLVVECDLRRPRIHTLAEWEDDDTASAGSDRFTLKRDAASGMYGITAASYDDSERGLRHLAYQVYQIVEAARHRFDLVLLDTPPVLAVADAEAFARQSDGIIMVVDRRRDRRDRVHGALLRLSACTRPVLGFIYNSARRRSLVRYGYSGYADDAPKKIVRAPLGQAT